MSPVDTDDMIFPGKYALERVDEFQARIQLVENSNESLLSAKEQQAQKISDLEKSLKDQGDALATLKEENTILREDLAQIRASIQQLAKAKLETQQSLFDNNFQQVRESLDKKPKEVEWKLGEKNSVIEGLRLPLSNIAKTVESRKKEIVNQKERLDMYTNSHNMLSNAWIIVNQRVPMETNSDGSTVKRKNSMGGEDQGSAKRQSTSAGPEATGDGSFTSTHGSD
ncbi:uncharacterized protein LW93_3658 [Fusarium fujikuroi]|nr:uncharacterized protein LW93_3658 [Fusarium fujikuroi]